MSGKETLQNRLNEKRLSELNQAVDMLLPTQAVKPRRGKHSIAPRNYQLAAIDALYNQQ